MTPQQIADLATRLGFSVTLQLDDSVTLEEEVWVIDGDDAQDEVLQRCVQIRNVLRASGLNLPLSTVTLGRDYVFGTIIPLTP